MEICLTVRYFIVTEERNNSHFILVFVWLISIFLTCTNIITESMLIAGPKVLDKK